MLPAYPLGEKHTVLKKRALRLFELFNMTHKASSKIEWLSGGEVQRVTIIRALINDPYVSIADEPTAHLDTKLSRGFMEIVGKFREEKKAVLIASHDPLVCQSNVVDRVVNLRDGRIDGESS